MASAPPTWSQEKSFLGLAVTDLSQLDLNLRLDLNLAAVKYQIYVDSILHGT